MRSSMRVAVALVLAGVMSLPARAYAQFPFPSPKPQATQAPAADPRVAQVKAGLEKEGLKVLLVEFKRTSDNEPQWFAQTAANYAQPNWRAVSDQAFVIWGVLFSAASSDGSQTWLSGSQVWNKYGIFLHTQLGSLTTLVNDLRNAKTDAEKKAAFDKFQIVFRVFDHERSEFVENKDFINKNFTS